MSTPNATNGSGTLMWFKSSYSGNAGGDCVEISYDWRKSSHSGNEGGQCVEVAEHARLIHVRDSKDPNGPMIDVTPASWVDFVRFAADHASGAA